MGRPRKPTALKIVDGNPGKRPIGEEAQPEEFTKLPKAPKTLSKDAKTMWRNTGNELLSAGLLTKLDLHGLQLYCEAYDRYLDANEKLLKIGTVIKSPSGYPIQSPYFAIAKTSFDQMRSIMNGFGMSPSSRSGLAVAKKEDKGSGFFD